MDGKYTHEKMLNIISHQGMQSIATIMYHFIPMVVGRI